MVLSAEEYSQLAPEEQHAYDEEVRAQEKLEQDALPYRWTQTLEHVELSLAVPQGTRAKQVQVLIKRTSLCIGWHGVTVAEVCSYVLCRASFLSLSSQMTALGRLVRLPSNTDDGTTLSIHLEKENANEWWAHVLKHDPTIDTTKIQPVDSTLSDLDGETRYVV